MSQFRSSGNLAADRRYLWGDASRKGGDWQAASELFEQAVELAPDWAGGWYALGDALERTDRIDAAREAFSRCNRLDHDGDLGAGLRLARLRGEAIDQMPAAFVAGLFDSYATQFDRHLTGQLAYRGPEILVAAIESCMSAPGRPHQFAEVLDIGCGTGLLAEALGARARHIDGVDLSAGMVEVARGKGLYRRLVVGDAVSVIGALAPGTGYDLVAAADVLVYIGDLTPLFRAAAGALRSNGLFAFTVQSHEGPGYKLGADMRFHHADSYVRELGRAVGLECRLSNPAVTRTDGGKDVAGRVVVLRRET